jgi:hypothetical protein
MKGIHHQKKLSYTVFPGCKNTVWHLISSKLEPINTPRTPHPTTDLAEVQT